MHRAELGRKARAEERELVSGRRARHVNVGFGDIDIAMRPHHGDGDARVTQRIALPSDRDRHTGDVRQRDISQERDVHQRSLGGGGKVGGLPAKGIEPAAAGEASRGNAPKSVMKRPFAGRPPTSPAGTKPTANYKRRVLLMTSAN